MDVLPALLRVTSSMANHLSDMDPATAHSTQGCKILHLVRHAQGVHNTVVGKGPEALLSQELFDAQLSDLGFKQVEKLRTEVEERELTKKIDLVIASPMLRLSVKLRKGLNIIIITSSNLTISLLRKAFSCWRPCNAMQVLFSRRRLGSLRCKWFDCRTLQTAVGVFGGGGSQANGFHVDGETAVNGDKFAKIDGPPIIAVEHCRERWGLEPCNRRRSIHEYQTLFPGIDFQLIESEDDILWKADVRESYEEVAARGIKFLKWLWTRQEKEIAIVSHGIFLQQTLQKLAKETNQSMENLCSRFGNCEIRTVAINIADGSIIYHPHDVRKEDTQRKEASN